MSNISARLDRLPLSKFHHKIIGVLAAGMFFDGFDLYIMAGIIAVLVKTGFTNAMGVANLIALNYAGLFLGSLIGGYAADRWGRRSLFVWGMLCYSIGSILCAFAPNMTALLVLRFLTALGLGGELPIGYAMLGEFIPASKRGKWAAILACITNLSAPVATFAGMFLLPYSIGWRIMFVIAGIPAIFAYFIQRHTPESPRWYEIVGRQEEAEKIVSEIENDVRRTTGKELPPVVAAEETILKKVSFFFIFNKAVIGRVLMATIMWVVVLTATYSFQTWLPTVFVQKGMTITKSMGYTTIMMLGAPIAAFVGAFISDAFSRKKMLIGIALAGAVLSYAYTIGNSETVILILGFCIICSLSLMQALGNSAYVPEHFPTAIRAGASGFANSISRITSAISPYIVLFLMSKVGFNGVLIFMSALMVLFAVVVGIVGVETKGKSLEEINKKILTAIAAESTTDRSLGHRS